MQIELNGVALFRMLALLTAVLFAPLAQAGASCQKQETPEFAVARLYRDYAWQVVGNAKTFGNEAVDLRRQSLPELQKYFDPALAELISRTRNCTEKKRAVCTPGFDVIFAAHGRAVSDLDVIPMNKKNTVRVKFKNPIHDQVFWLDYKMVQTPQGWRVADIQYSNNNTNLRDSLTEALKQSDSAPVTQAGPAGQTADTPEAAVRRLYRDYAWMGVGSSDLDCSLTGLEEQTLPELRKYFDDGLASRLRADHECTERIHGACNLDYPIILGISLAQDPMFYDLTISEANKENQVLVTFKYPTHDELFRLRYDMVKTDDGWRIHDIYDPNLKIYLRGRFPDKPGAEVAGAAR